MYDLLTFNFIAILTIYPAVIAIDLRRRKVRKAYLNKKGRLVIPLYIGLFDCFPIRVKATAKGVFGRRLTSNCRRDVVTLCAV